MKNKKLFITTIVGVFAIMGLAFFSHEHYNQAPCVLTAVTFPVNESPWEHTKLFYIPVIIWYIIEFAIVGRKYKNYFFAHAVSMVVMPIAMLLIYYGYLALGFVNTVCFSIILTASTIIIGSALGYLLTISKKSFKGQNLVAAILLAMMISMYAIFTYYQPNVGLFYDKFNCCKGIVNNPHK